MSDAVELSYVVPENKLMYPHQPSHDDFLEIMSKVLLWARCFGVVGSSRRFWRIWGVFVFLMILAIEGGTIYKLIKLLLGLTAYSTGNRSVTARLAGLVFYSSSLIALVLSWKLSCSWDKISAEWASVEWKFMMNVPADVTLRRRLITVISLMASVSMIEHLLSIVSSVNFDQSASEILKTYIITSHAFIILPSDYSIWLAMLILFVSNMSTILWNFQDLLIILVSMGLTSRYYRLNQCVAKASTNAKQDSKLCKNTDKVEEYMWRKIREAYVKQAMLVRRVDQYLGFLILLSSFSNFYFICLNVFLGITQGLSGELNQKLYYLVSLIWLCLRFSWVVLAAAEVNVQSKKALQHLHACNAQCYNVEVERLQKQLTKEYIALSGMGFFYIDRTILLQMAGTIVTYGLVLVQVDSKGSDDHVPLNAEN